MATRNSTRTRVNKSVVFSQVSVSLVVVHFPNRVRAYQAHAACHLQNQLGLFRFLKQSEVWKHVHRVVIQAQSAASGFGARHPKWQEEDGRPACGSAGFEHHLLHTGWLRADRGKQSFVYARIFLPNIAGWNSYQLLRCFWWARRNRCSFLRRLPAALQTCQWRQLPDWTTPCLRRSLFRNRQMFYK